LRFVGGLTMKESAERLNVSEETVRRDWQFAKTWLLRELSAGAERKQHHAVSRALFSKGLIPLFFDAVSSCRIAM